MLWVAIGQIAVAVEMLRDETLNVFAACLRHGFKMSDFGRSFNAHILERYVLP